MGPRLKALLEVDAQLALELAGVVRSVELVRGLSCNISERAARAQTWEIWNGVIQDVCRIDSDLEAFVFGQLDRLAGVHVKAPLPKVFDRVLAEIADMTRHGVFQQEFARRAVGIALVQTDYRANRGDCRAGG